MKVAIEVKDRNEATALQAGLGIPVVKATVVIAGMLKPLSAGERKLVMDTLSAWNLQPLPGKGEDQPTVPVATE